MSQWVMFENVYNIERFKTLPEMMKKILADAGYGFSSIVLDASRCGEERDNLLDATIVYDHFRMIKAVNDKLNGVRRRTYVRIATDVRRCICALDVGKMSKEEKCLGRQKGAGACLRIIAEIGEAYALKEWLSALHLCGMPHQRRSARDVRPVDAKTEGFNSKIRWLQVPASEEFEFLGSQD